MATPLRTVDRRSLTEEVSPQQPRNISNIYKIIGVAILSLPIVGAIFALVLYRKNKNPTKGDKIAYSLMAIPVIGPIVAGVLFLLVTAREKYTAWQQSRKVAFLSDLTKRALDAC